MSFKAGRFLAALFIVSLLIQMHIAGNGHTAAKTKIVFTSIRDGNGEIYVMDGDGRNQKRVTVNRVIDRHPTWSPDGKKIAFVSNRNKGYLQIWVMDADGWNPFRLTNGLLDIQPDWSPDGKKIAFAAVLHPKDLDNSPHVIFVMDADGTNERQLIGESGSSPSWSPDGKRIAFVSGRDSNINQIYVMDSDGGHQRRITDDLVDKLTPSWSPDGKRIAYSSGNGIYVMDSDGKNQRILTNGMGDEHPTWSPDSDAIAFQSFRDGGAGIYTIDIKRRIIHTLVPAPGLRGVEPDWFDPRQLAVDRTGNHITIWGRLKDIARRLR